MSEKESQNLEDNIPMVNYIMLHRIYDMMTLVANLTAKNEEDRQKISKMVEYHKQGYLLGPTPSYISGEKDDIEQK
jgi:transcriptional regulator of NAD metabolism